MSQPPLVLVDGSSYLFRAFHALPPLTAPDGAPTGAMIGVANMLRKLRADYGPEHMAVVFDAKGKTFRDDIYPEYKATRPPMPDELAAQIEPLHELVRAMGLPLLCVGGVEADDVIATLADQAARAGHAVVISTGDKDLAQLVDDRITLVNTMSGVTLDPDGVREKFGVAPEQIVDYLALMGDSVDNIPGVDKVGPKTAAKWIAKYGDLDTILEQADDIGGKIGENLRAATDRLPTSRELITVKRDVPLDVGPDDLAIQEPDHDRLLEMVRRYGFTRWRAELEGGNGDTAADNPGPAQTKGDYQTVREEADFAGLLERLDKAERVAFDTETTSLDAMRAELVGMSFAFEPGTAYYLPLAHTGPDADPQLPFDTTLERLKPWLESPGHGKLGHHLKYDRNVLGNHGITLRGIVDDTLLESFCLDAGANRHDLDSLAERHLDYKTTHYEDVAGKGAKQIPFAEVDIGIATDYAGEDADICLQLDAVFQPRLKEAEGPAFVYREIEMPLVPVLADIERAGVKVDPDQLGAQSQALLTEMERIEREAFEEAGGEFNLGSPKQIQEILFERLGLPVLRRTPKGQPSTAEDVLEQMAGDYALPRLILEHRGLSKLRSTYTETLPRRIHPKTGRVHTSYHQSGAATGRLSSSEPNLQNIPVRTEAGRRIRQAFIAEAGHQLLAADYSQIELRIMAHLSQDAGLLRAFAEGQDIHRATAAEVFGTEPDQVSNDQRRAAKAINFGLIYGMSAWGLARNLGIEQGEAREYIDRYFNRYPGVHDYMEKARASGRENGYVETLFGRRLYLPEINSRNGARRQQSERVAINAPMQGTAADIIKRAMVRVANDLSEARIDARMIMQVHDELVFEVADDALDALTDLVRQAMSGAADLDVELVVDIGVGANWDDAH
ncbi:DNA polymerase I [Thioalkalivibrio versutus]|uniref:DNA polymerase I n=1 Tax=Thioalkalivibrio versutus TaxID=106634 RepID=A0A0G3GBM8_9GAMM|nr:DNA polymerase I [Thioalkalivibrio versutus]AKJ96221.1 DNA polymerase I [Thioalkalivibrio versutus]